MKNHKLPLTIKELIEQEKKLDEKNFNNPKPNYHKSRFDNMSAERKQFWIDEHQ